MPRKSQSRYAEKRERGLVPHRYDRDSKRFNEGAWPNLSPAERDCNERAAAKQPKRGCGKNSQTPKTIWRNAHGHRLVAA